MVSLVPDGIRQRIEGLIRLKASQDKGYLHPQEPKILEYLVQTFAKNETGAKNLPAS